MGGDPVKKRSRWEDDMKREQLKEMGLTDEQIEKVMAENGKDIEKHKGEAETVKQELAGLQTQLAERDKQFKTLQDNQGDAAALKEQITKLQADNKAQQTAHEQAMKDLKLQTAISQALIQAEAIDPELVQVKLKRDNIKLNDDGTLTGLSEQLEGVKKDYGFLFKAKEQPTITGAEPANNTKPPAAKTPDQMTYSEMMAYMAANPGAKI